MTRLGPVVIGAFGIVILLLAAQSFVGSGGFAYDYEAYDLAARRLVAGQALYPAGLAEAYNSGAYAGLYLYPPPLAVGVMPLTVLGPADAAMVWLAARIALLVLGVALLPVSALARGSVLAVAAISFPVWYDLNLGNLSVIILFLSSVIWRFRDGVVGSVALAVAGVLRYPFGLVLLGWLLARRWKAVAWTVAAGVVIVTATLPVVGIQGWLDYLAALSGLRDVSAGEHNLSLATTARSLGLPGPDGLWVAVGIGAAGIATAWATLRRDPETALVVSLTGAIFFFPFFHPHYLVQLLIPAAFLAGRGQWWGLLLPLLGWLPGEYLAPAAIVATLLPLVPPRFASFSAAARSGEAAGFETGPTPP